MFLSASLLAFLLYRVTDAQWALLWWVLVLTYTGWRYLFSESLIRHPSQSTSARRIVALLFLSGLVMAIPLFWFDRFSEIERAAITIVMCSTSAAAVSTTAGYRSYFLAFSLPMLLPLQLAWVMTHWDQGLNSPGLGLAALILLYVGVLLSVGKQSFANFLESCQIRFGERALNQRLSAALERESEANRAKTQFLAAASHDLRQPIHSLNVLVAALAHRPLDDRSREIVQLLQSVNESLSSELDGLLEVSKLDAGAVKPVLAPVSLSDLISGHAAALQPLAMERGIHLDVQVTKGVQCITDAVLLNRIVSNLTSNALKFTLPGGTVRLSVFRKGTKAFVEVSDTGIGVAPEEQERIFREFYQVGNVERDRNHGLGLGLSIVRRYGELLGIKLRVESALGKGTKMSLEWAAIDFPAAAVDGGTTEIERRFPDGFTVLLLDDEAQIRSSMRLMFEEWGIRLFDVESVAAAAEVLRLEKVDHILSDLRLRDEETGLDLLPILKHLGLNTPVTLITGDTAPERILMAHESGIQLLHKPVSAAVILRTLQEKTG
jgi:signal transduction histidine kinase